MVDKIKKFNGIVVDKFARSRGEASNAGEEGQHTISVVIKRERGEQLGIAFEEGCNKVVAVRADSAAHKAGIVASDEILKLNGELVPSSEADAVPAVVSAVQALPADSQICLTVLRGCPLAAEPRLSPKRSSADI
mmetsp:Transcript_57877/g.95592  ORF Transcript_57877/g.95592 Transcript_57877/m.95592 type:complete len:135 (+) Transcript_57877:81-485(+)|eukprot:CAMPEP_0119322678 /NCGR_PEP_ID=MMETSP1333-20130426/58878_1 /TAXON_ID=418940 /ORGANISM="Scyphosphaera apsteinii, Strain RCC1455" /LENGTH=134 /DNA_ID=CAMNT_0007329963 /DNA_START=80 /DNA_END=484 /DNA_ORIENTATION=-